MVSLTPDEVEEGRIMKKTVLIIEDDRDQLNMLKKLVLTVSESAEVYTADNASAAYQILLEKTIDVFLVDIILDTQKPGDTTGVRLVERFRAIPKYMFTPVIFVTSLEDPNMYCYKDLNCIGYIEKPFAPAMIIRLVEKALHYSTERGKEASLTFRKDGILYPIKVKDIIYLESLNHIMHIHLEKGSTLEIPYLTCKQILAEADSESLVQCSRCTIINKDYVQSVDIVNRVIVFRDKLGRVDIGITYKKRMIAEFRYDS